MGNTVLRREDMAGSLFGRLLQTGGEGRLLEIIDMAFEQHLIMKHARN